MKKVAGDVLGTAIEDEGRLKLKIKKLVDNAVVPTFGTANSAGLDLYATEDCRVIGHGSSVMIHTGLAVEIPKGYVGLLFARSGLANKRHLRPSNCVGVIDADYRGEVMVSLFNDNEDSVEMVEAGERVAQLVIMPYVAPDIVECDELSDTDRGTGGFGSTGK